MLCTVFDLLVISFAFAFWCSDWELQWFATYSSFCTVDFDSKKKRPNLGKIPEAMSLSMTVTASQTKTPEQTRKRYYVQCSTISLYFMEINKQQHSLGLKPTYLSWQLSRNLTLGRVNKLHIYSKKIQALIEWDEALHRSAGIDARGTDKAWQQLPTHDGSVEQRPKERNLGFITEKLCSEPGLALFC